MFFEEKKEAEDKDPELLKLKKKYKSSCRRIFDEKAMYYKAFTGGAYNTIRIGDQRSRWGSCSSNGTLSFNWRLILAPPEILDYVVIHELCHLTHMNHSKAFWELVESVDPDYKEHERWLRENGDTLTLIDLKKAKARESSKDSL